LPRARPGRTSRSRGTVRKAETLYIGQSHDFGETWTQQKLSDDKRCNYADDTRVLSDTNGTVGFSESSIVCSGLTNVSGEVWHHAVISRDKGATWAGFDEIYRDYGEIDVTSTGKTIAAWGEGFSWIGTGGTWFNIER
jgi:hypothetical protein